MTGAAVGARAKALAGAVVGVTLGALWLATRESTARILGRPPVGFVAVRVALGPVTGWIDAARSGAILMGLWSLVPATMFCAGPLVLWLRNYGWGWLVVAALFWLASGYFFGIAIWV